MRQVLDRYKEMDYTFGSSRECKLLGDLTNAELAVSFGSDMVLLNV